MPKLLIILFTCLLLLSSCERWVPCSDGFITPAFVGFQPADLDTIIVRQYTKDGSFRQLIDTVQLVFDTTLLKTRTVNDTTFVLLNYISGQEKYLFPDHDWQLYLPARKLTVSIAGIVSTPTDSSCFKCSCTNPISSLVQNTQTVIPQSGKIPFLGGMYWLTYIHG